MGISVFNQKGESGCSHFYYWLFIILLLNGWDMIDGNYGSQVLTEWLMFGCIPRNHMLLGDSGSLRTGTGMGTLAKLAYDCCMHNIKQLTVVPHLSWIWEKTPAFFLMSLAQCQIATLSWYVMVLKHDFKSNIFFWTATVRLQVKISQCSLSPKKKKTGKYVYHSKLSKAT